MEKFIVIIGVIVIIAMVLITLGFTANLLWMFQNGADFGHLFWAIVEGGILLSFITNHPNNHK